MSVTTILARGWTILAMLSLAGLLGACQQRNYNVPVELPQLVSSTTSSGTSGIQVAYPTAGIERAFLAPGGNYTMVTLRRRLNPKDNNGQEDVLCSAPSPDWATAVAMAQQLQGSGGITGKATLSLAENSSTSETISLLAGRTAGVVALRDGLYKACEAYANGVIGKDAYALILSQYGDLLVALASGGSAATGAGSGASSSAATPSNVAVSVSTGTPTSTTGTANTPKTTTTGSSDSTVAQMQLGFLQGLFVTCVMENDPTVIPAASGSPLFQDSLYHGSGKSFCVGLLDAMSKEVPALLKPASTTATPPPTAKKQVVKKPVVKLIPPAAPKAAA
jgi:hypothetical protein